MWRFSILLLAALGAATLSGCGQASSAAKPATAEQERQIAEKQKQVDAEERQHQEQERNAAGGAAKR